jgi:hypothetical protein
MTMSIYFFLFNIIWILVHVINWILINWFVSAQVVNLSIVWFYQNFHLKFRHEMIVCVFMCVKDDDGKIQVGFVYEHTCNHSDWSNPFVEDTRLVSCTTINLTISSHGVTWVIHNICCDLYLDIEYGISRRLVYPNMWKLFDLPMIKYRNIIFTYTTKVCCSVSAWNHCYNISLYRHLAFITNAFVRRWYYYGKYFSLVNEKNSP